MKMILVARARLNFVKVAPLLRAIAKHNARTKLQEPHEPNKPKERSKPNELNEPAALPC